MDEPNSTPARFGMGHEQRTIDALLERLLRDQEIEPGSAPILDKRSDLITLPYKDTGLSFAFVAFGVRIGVSLEDPTLLDSILDRIPEGWAPIEFSNLANHYRVDSSDEDGEHWYRLAAEREGGLGRNNRALLPDAFETSLEDFVAQNATPWIFLHAGVVGWRGQAIVLPASSFSGKSTLTAALVAAGATYYSDEFAVLDRCGMVWPFPRRISLRAGEGQGWRTRRVDIVGPRTSAEERPPLPIGLVALLSYDPDRTFWVERLDPGVAIMALCEHSVAIRRRPADTFAVLQNIVGAAKVMRGFRGEAGPASSRLLAMIEHELGAR